MAFFKMSEALAAYDSFRARQPWAPTAESLILAEVKAFSPTKQYNVFLSHSFSDAKAVFGVKLLLEAQGLTVYVDWVEDALLDRSRVTPQTAEILRLRMRSSAALIFATSQSSPGSKWMPWELGYFDGLRNGRVFILPLVGETDNSFKGQEYLGLYPVVEKVTGISGKLIPAVTRPDSYGISRTILLADAIRSSASQSG